jgi:acetyltransferase-like isoleucine patch superfamily enzyme
MGSPIKQLHLKDARRKRRLENVDALDSKESGLAWIFEIALRRFRNLMHGLTLVPLYAMAALCLGAALLPGAMIFSWADAATAGSHRYLHLFALTTALAVGYFAYGFTLILLVPLVNFLARTKLRPWRGPYYSFAAARWYIHNGLAYLVRYTFLPFITPTPFNLMYFRLMGMKIGRGTQINSEHISDPSLIELGERVTIGGSVTLVAHYGMSGYLIIAPVTIGDGAVIGLKSTIMGGVEIGKFARVLPNSVVLPKTRIPEGETWGGVPARKIETPE